MVCFSLRCLFSALCWRATFEDSRRGTYLGSFKLVNMLTEGKVGLKGRIAKFLLKGIVHLNIIFSYMKVNKKCNLDHPVY